MIFEQNLKRFDPTMAAPTVFVLTPLCSPFVYEASRAFLNCSEMNAYVFFLNLLISPTLPSDQKMVLPFDQA